jgi:hypothetical protein
MHSVSLAIAAAADARIRVTSLTGCGRSVLSFRFDTRKCQCFVLLLNFPQLALV